MLNFEASFDNVCVCVCSSELENNLDIISGQNISYLEILIRKK